VPDKRFQKGTDALLSRRSSLEEGKVRVEQSGGKKVRGKLWVSGSKGREKKKRSEAAPQTGGRGLGQQSFPRGGESNVGGGLT